MGIGSSPELFASVVTGTFTLANNTNEQTVLTIPAANQLVDVELDLNGLAQANTVRDYSQTDGTNARQISSAAFPAAFSSGTKVATLSHVQKGRVYTVTLQATVAEGAAVAIPYAYMLRPV